MILIEIVQKNDWPTSTFFFSVHLEQKV